MPAPYEKKIITIDTVSWTAIDPPFDCDVIIIRNNGAPDVYLRTDKNDSNTQDTLKSTIQEVVGFATNATKSYSYRFKVGYPRVWAQAATGTGPLLVTFIE